MSGRRLIVNADDFGLSEGVDDGIIEAFGDGIVTSTSLMVDRPAARHAAALAHRHPSLSVGLHFEAPASVDLDNPDAAARAFELQLECFRSLLQRDPTHVDSHHHVHAQGDRMQTFRRLVAPLAVPLRHTGQVAYIDRFYAQPEIRVTELRYVSRPFLLELVQTEALEGFTELGCHPARLTGDFASSYLREREVELTTLTSAGLRADIEALGVELVSFHDWRG